ncbi:MAG: hypothetical protein WB586_16040 [Chthoniobacterales bacterium]
MNIQAPTTQKPVVKVTVGGPRYGQGALFYTYLIAVPGVFQKIGHSEDPHKLAMSMLPFPGLILLEARAFLDKRQAMAFESEVHRKYAGHRIVPPACANPRSTKYYAPGAAIHL